MNILYFWFTIMILFLIVEMLTATFYGLSLSLAALITALFVLMSGERDFTILQGVIFAVTSAIFAYFLPKYVISQAPDKPQGMDRYTGEKRSVKKVSGDYKISLDGVDYLIESDDTLNAGDKVVVTGHKGSSIIVKKI